MPIRSRSTERANPSRSVIAAAALATSSGVGPAPDGGRGDHAEHDRAAAFDELADAVEVGGGQGGHIDRCGMNSASLQHVPRYPRRTAVQRNFRAYGGNAVVEQSDGHRFVNGMHGREARHAGQPALERGGQQRFVELHHDGGVQSPRHVRAVGGHALGERPRQIPHGAGVCDGTVSVRQFQLCGKCDRTRGLHLHRPCPAAQAGLLPGLLERVDVLVEQARCPAGHRAAS